MYNGLNLTSFEIDNEENNLQSEIDCFHLSENHKLL